MKHPSLIAKLFLAGLITSVVSSYSFGATTESSSTSRTIVTSDKSFDQVSDSVQSLVAKNGMMIMAQVDQGKMLSMTGLSLKARLYLIGNPTIGKQLFEQDHGVGLYIPLRLFVYSDENGKTHLAYDRPSELLSQFENEKVKMIAQMLDQKLEALAKMAAE